jgi:hypothetical protein
MQKQILAICTHPGILETILRLINNNPAWHAVGSSSAEDAKALLSSESIDLVLLGNGLSPEEEKDITDYAKAVNSQIRLVQHFGGGSGLLSAEIYGALA